MSRRTGFVGGGAGAALAGVIVGAVPTYVSGTSVRVRQGRAVTLAGVLLELVADRTIDLTAPGVVDGWDRATLTGTVAITSGSAAVAGTGTAFLTGFGRRAITGTIGTGGLASTTVTVTNGRATEELAAGDLFGTDAAGFKRVLAVVDDSTVTLEAALTIADGTTGLVIEQPTIQVGSAGVRAVVAIASDTALTAGATWGSTASAQTAYAGARLTTAVSWCNLWAIGNGSAVRAFASTQRTALLSPPTGYTAAARLGSILLGDDGAVVDFRASRKGSALVVHCADDLLHRIGRAFGPFTSTSRMTIDLSGTVPPGAREVLLRTQAGGAAGNLSLFADPSAAENGFHYAGPSTTVVVQNPPQWAPCRAQLMQAAVDTGVTAYGDVAGYTEELP